MRPVCQWHTGLTSTMQDWRRLALGRCLYRPGGGGFYARISSLPYHLRILSGLYGVLRPLDLMQAPTAGDGQ
jgi:hypothetical protein